MKSNARYVEAAFPIPIRQEFTYRIPDSLLDETEPGRRIYAPFGKREKSLGFAVRLRDTPPKGITDIKPIESVLDDQPVFSQELFQFLQWVSDYYLTSLGETLSAAYPFSPAIRPRTIKVVLLNEEICGNRVVPEHVKGEKQRRALEYLIHHKTPLSPSDLAQKAGVSSATINTLKKNGFIHFDSREAIEEAVNPIAELNIPSFALTDEQQYALAIIQEAFEQPSPKPILIYGITGSGKTEIYLRAIEQCLQRGQSALALIPEIALTPQTIERFRSRFGDVTGILHSGIGQGERYNEWRLARQGKRRIIVGARSAVFAPLENPGLIIVDEEHESSYKQSDPSPRYNGRDLAVVRAKMAGAVCLLGSATPAIESAYNVQTKKYKEIRLTKRISKHGLPNVNLVDMRGRGEEEEVLARELQDALWEVYERKRQSILFLNRRGFATSLSCKKCGHILDCKHCSVALVYHKSRDQLVCHHCDYRASLPNHCPSCKERFIRQRGFGTERVVETVKELLPNARVIRLDRDTTQRKGEHERLLNQFKQGQADVMVGTQMIAKGLDFPNVTLVGIINADYALSLPDFRAAERTFTLLTQVAGRAGRGEYAGAVFVQSHCPDHYSIQLALHQRYELFYEREIRYRKLISFPPFSRLVLWRIEGTNEGHTRGRAWELYKTLSDGLSAANDVILLPPVEAPLYRLRDHYRWQVALKCRNHRSFRPVLNSESVQKILHTRHKGLRVIQDIDPWDML